MQNDTEHIHHAIENATSPGLRQYLLIEHLAKQHDADDPNGVIDLDALHADKHAEFETPVARLGQARRARDQLLRTLDRLLEVDLATHDKLIETILAELRGRLRP